MSDWWIDDTPYPGPYVKPTFADTFVELVRGSSVRAIEASQAITEWGTLVARVSPTIWFDGQGGTGYWWFKESTPPDPKEELKKLLEKAYPGQQIRVDAGGIHIDNQWLMTEAVKRMTKEVRARAADVAKQLDNQEILKVLDEVNKEKRETGAGRVQNHGPRSRSTFGRRGRKNY